MNKHALEIDYELCWGCKTCEVACKQEYSHEVQFIHVLDDGPRVVGDKYEYFHRPTVCRHCDDPPCAEACPEEAISKRDDGIVILDEAACTGCQTCMDACPYNAIAFDETNQKHSSATYAIIESIGPHSCLRRQCVPCPLHLFRQSGLN